MLNARHMRNVLGRKTDVGDDEWICQRTEHGLVRPSFVAPKEVGDLREFSRYRRALARSTPVCSEHRPSKKSRL